MTALHYHEDARVPLPRPQVEGIAGMVKEAMMAVAKGRGIDVGSVRCEIAGGYR